MNAPRNPVQRCRFCGCTPEESCKIPGGDECAFLDARATRCNAPACVQAFEAERDREWLREAERVKILRALRQKSSKKRTNRGKQRRAA